MEKLIQIQACTNSRFHDINCQGNIQYSHTTAPFLHRWLIPPGFHHLFFFAYHHDNQINCDQGTPWMMWAARQWPQTTKMSSGDFPDRGAFISIEINHKLTQIMEELDNDHLNCSDVINPNKLIFGELERYATSSECYDRCSANDFVPPSASGMLNRWGGVVMEGEGIRGWSDSWPWPPIIQFWFNRWLFYCVLIQRLWWILCFK